MGLHLRCLPRPRSRREASFCRHCSGMTTEVGLSASGWGGATGLRARRSGLSGPGPAVEDTAALEVVAGEGEGPVVAPAPVDVEVPLPNPLVPEPQMLHDPQRRPVLRAHVDLDAVQP